MRTDPYQLDLFEPAAQALSSSVRLCDAASESAMHLPPWARSTMTSRISAGMYVAIPGGRDEPPGELCTACGWAGGGHGQRCAVAEYELQERACWEDAQFEAGDPALWADLIAATQEAAEEYAAQPTLGT